MALKNAKQLTFLDDGVPMDVGGSGSKSVSQPAHACVEGNVLVVEFVIDRHFRLGLLISRVSPSYWYVVLNERERRGLVPVDVVDRMRAFFAVAP